jgi:dTDP-4-dehydrorhamnose reductase
MKILVTGAGGQLGSEIKKLSAQYPKSSFVFTDFPETDLTKPNDISRLFNEVKPDFCINTAAYTAVDLAEMEKEAAFALNAKSLDYLAKACKAHNTKFIHISTDFVFDGNASSPLTEDMPTSAVNYYGESKREGEKILENQLNDNFIILRTSWLYSTFQKNFVKTMLHLGRTKEALKVIYDQVGTPTYAEDLAKVILQIIHDKTWSSGIYHFSNEGVASWYDFAMAVFTHKGIEIPVEPVRTSAFPTPAKRPAYSVMSKEKIKDAYDIKIRHWQAALEDCLSKLD